MREFLPVVIDVRNACEFDTAEIEDNFLGVGGNQNAHVRKLLRLCNDVEENPGPQNKVGKYHKIQSICVQKALVGKCQRMLEIYSGTAFSGKLIIFYNSI